MSAIEKEALYSGLLEKFLYNKDHDCVYNIFDMDLSEGHYKNLSPSYKMVKNIRRRLSYFFRDVENKTEIVNYISKEIGEDINRLEVYLNIIAHNLGYSNTSEANKLEIKMVRGISNNQDCLFFELENEEVDNFKKKLLSKLIHDERNTENIKEIVRNFSNTLIKKKIYSLNSREVGQLILKYDDTGYSISDLPELVTRDEIDELYKRIFRSMYKNAVKVYEEAYWQGLIDRVMARYS
ncbi:MAG: hypothetical protein GX219_05260 [Tissierellia bacterium]|nr:hypothetical protein [Tissierellia bacterium]